MKTNSHVLADNDKEMTIHTTQASLDNVYQNRSEIPMIMDHNSGSANASHLASAVAHLPMKIFQDDAVETTQATNSRVVGVIPQAKKQTKEEKHDNEPCDSLTSKATVVAFPSVPHDNETILIATRLNIARVAPEDKRILTV